MAVINVPLRFRKKKCLSAASGFLDSSSVCFSGQESNVSDAPAGELHFSCEFLLWAVDHQSNDSYRSTVLIHIFHKHSNVPG